MTRAVVFVVASPSPVSRSGFVARLVASRLEEAGVAARFFSLADFDAADVFAGRASAPSVAAFVRAVTDSAGIVLASPVYKASYTGALKAVIDLVPPDALVERVALGIATARLEGHGDEVAAAYRALFRFFRARVVDPVVVRDTELALDGSTATLSAAAEERIAAAGRAFADMLG